MTSTSIESYRDLIVWQKSMDLVVEIYRLTRSFPSSELYGIASQIKRAAVSIPSNIAEGRRRNSRNDFRHFLVIAFGSGAELETQIEICKRLDFGRQLDYNIVDTLLNDIMRMLNVLISRLRQPPTTNLLPTS